ncbi:MAG: hypothetical protein JRI49_05980, partial [Deltaproteobacteria bacterium]|nr:hypothetical protein [Deltaproteobacteria bacterium]
MSEVLDGVNKFSLYVPEGEGDKSSVPDVYVIKFRNLRNDWEISDKYHIEACYGSSEAQINYYITECLIEKIMKDNPNVKE